MIFGIGFALMIIGWLSAMGTGVHHGNGNEKSMIIGFFMSIILLSAGVYLICAA